MYRDIEIIPELQEALREYRQGNYREAQSICEELADTESGSRTERAALLLMARCRIARGDMETALDMYSQAMLLAEDKLEERGICEEAMEAEADMDFCGKNLYRIAVELQRQGYMSEAAEAFNKAGVCSYRAGGNIGKESEMYETAMSIMESAEDCSDNQVLLAMVCGNLAECRQRQRRPMEALELYKRASDMLSHRLDDETCLLHHAMYCCSAAEIYSQCGDNVKASTLLSSTIDNLEMQYILSDEVRSQIIACCNAYSMVCFQMGDYEGGVNACNKALRLKGGLEDEETETILYSRAQAYEAMEKFAAAAADYRRCISILENTDTAENRLIAALRRIPLGHILDGAGKLAEATEYYEQAAQTIDDARADDVACSEVDNDMLTDIEALCRFRLGKIFTRTETRNYYRACKEYQACLELLQSVDMSPVRATQFSAAHTALAELYEMFDEYDKAQTHYAEANKYDAVASLGELIMSAAMPEDDAVCDDGSGYFLSDESDEEDDTPEA
ncbi:MAG: hypothetical protein E7559_05350 [Ruminococcaceae bacterium]|nr:hypothetical protein [Oscillospiraceae bacterium]